jgi:tetratricopeptide (TPR) repeat protein
MPYLFVGWLWYAITLLPVIGIIQVGDFAMADRYHYLPSIGIAVMLAWGVPLLFPHEDMRKKILCPAVIIALAILAVLTWQQCGYWKNNTTLFSNALQVTKDNYLAHNNLGLTLFTEGNTEEAIYHYNKAIRIKTKYTDAYFNRGVAYFKLGQYQRAIDDYNESIRLKPHYADVYKNRGSAYFKLAQYQRAIDDYSEAIHLKPDYIDVYINRGLAYSMQGNNELVCRDAHKACDLGNCIMLESPKGREFCR